MAKRSFKFWTGIILLTTNQLIGWGGVVFCGLMAAKTGKKSFWITTGVVIYAISWAMVPLGVVLAGPEGVTMVKQLFAKSKLWVLRRKALPKNRAGK